MSEPINRDPNAPFPLDDSYTDVQWAADEAARALRAGRYRLAASFANLAARAEDHLARAAAYVTVPMLGQTRTEAPARPGDCEHPWHRLSGPDGEPLEAQCPDCGDVAHPGTGPTGNGDRDLAAAAALEEPTGRLQVVKASDLEMTRIDPFDRALSAQAEAAATRLFGPTLEERQAAIVPDQVEAPAPRRCRAIVRRDGVQDECLQGIRWVPGWVAEAQQPPVQARWAHIDPALDSDHAPVAGN